MPDIKRIIKQLLEDAGLKEHSAFSSRTYTDQPIILTGRQLRERQERNRANLSSLPHVDYTPDHPASSTPQQLSLPDLGRPSHSQPIRQEKIPERYYQLRELTETQGTLSSSLRGSMAYGSRSANRLFYEQARLMEDFEDDYEFTGTYFQYFPTYSSMTLGQLRGYFSWRTRVRSGEMPEAPLSFAFLHVYELLCGIGTTAGEQGFCDLMAFWKGFSQTHAAQGSTFSSYMRRWLKDYAIYHNLEPAYVPGETGGAQAQVLTLLQAEETMLAQQGLKRKQFPLANPSAPNEQALLSALSDCSSYQICGARLYKTNPDDVRFVTCETFRALAVHCAKRRKTDFVEGLFGSGSTEPYTMFSSAVFYEPTSHEDAVVPFSPIETYICQEGRWRRSSICQNKARSTELGTILHAVDAHLRARLDYPYPLKERKTPVYVCKIVDKAIDTLLERKAEEERRRIDIDLSRLADIRAAAAVTQEALLTDEERGEDQSSTETYSAAGQETDPHVEEAIASTAWQDDQHGISQVPSQNDAESHVSQSESPLLLTPGEEQVLHDLLEGRSPEPNPEGRLLSLVIDAINEKLFDVVGDAVIEYEGDDPVLIEDYLEDVREIIEA